MTIVPVEFASWADFLAKVGQFLFGLCSVSLVIFALTVKRKEFFRTELDKKRLDELGRIRSALQSLFFDFNYIHFTSEMMATMNWSLAELQVYDPDAWEQYSRFRNTALDLIYKFSDLDYYLFPDWIERGKRERFAASMLVFAPFTMYSVSSKTQTQRDTFAVEISEMKSHFDNALRTHV